MVKAGEPVDAAIAELLPHLDPGDILIDGGNSLFTDTRRRSVEVEAKGFRYIGTGVSGGETGALEGPSIMPGGSAEAYAAVEPVLTSIAAQVDGIPCCTHIGTDGAGHYVKMVHNGIEYSDMQLIAEAYDLLPTGCGLSETELAADLRHLGRGRAGVVSSSTSPPGCSPRIDATGGALVNSIVDQAEQKGTGRWTSENALELGVPLTSITEAVFARMLSARRDERLEAADAARRSARPLPRRRRRHRLVDDVRDALYARRSSATRRDSTR